jgi:hypothetical protein
MTREYHVLCCDSARASLMHTLVSLILISLASFQAHARQADAAWPRFRDDVHHVSFAYPPELRPISEPAESLHIEGLVTRVSLVSSDPRLAGRAAVLTVNVLTCDEPQIDPRVPCRDESFYQSVCDRFERFSVGDSVGIQCVTYGRGACHWSAIVLRDKGRVEIRAFAAEYAANVTATDRSVCATRAVGIRMTSPVKELLASFRLRRSE